MQAHSGRRYRADPTLGQANRLTGWGHSWRALWNLALEQRQFAWHQRGRTLRSAEQCRHLTDARAQLPWLADLPAHSAQQVLRQLDRADDHWWNPAQPAPGPHLPETFWAVDTVSRPSRRSPQTLPQVGCGATAEAWLGSVSAVPPARRHGAQRHHHQRRPRLAHLVRGGGRHQRGPAEPPAGCGWTSGWPARRSSPTSGNRTCWPPRSPQGSDSGWLGLERRKARQVTWAKKHHGGRSSNRTRATSSQIATLRARQARRRQDVTHKLTTNLATNHGWVAVQDQQVKAMTTSAKGTRQEPGSNVKAKAGLNRAIGDNAPYERQRQLADKAPRFGSELRLVRPAFTSQTCSACGLRDPESRPGCGRRFACTACGQIQHAHRNAARNLHHLAAGQAVHRTRSHPRSGEAIEPDA
jgi:putative transposase